MNDIFEWLKSNFFNFPVQWLTFIVALTNLIITLKNNVKQRVKLILFQNEKSYYFSYIFYDKYDCIVFEININNKSNSSVTISQIELIDKNGNIYMPTLMNHQSCNFREKGNLCLFDDNDKDKYINYEVDKQNILNSLRLEKYDSLTGILYFENIDFQNYSENEKFILKISTPQKKFKFQVTSSKLPANYHPQHSTK